MLHRLVGPLLDTAAKRFSRDGALAGASIHRILVLRPNHRLGNLVLVTPLIAEIERIYPGAEIDVLAAGDAAYALFAGFARVRRVHALPRRIARHPLAPFFMIARLRKAHYDLVIDACSHSYSGRLLLALLARRHGLAPTDADPSVPAATPPRHLAQVPVFALRRALTETLFVDRPYPPPTIGLTRSEREQGERILTELVAAGGGSHVTLGVFAHASGAKIYAEVWWLRLLQVIRAGLPACTIIEFIAADGRSRLGDRFPACYSSDLRRLAAVASQLTCFISADCGVMHLAVASGTPTVGLFSVTDPDRYQPYGTLSRAVSTIGRTPEQVAALVLPTIRAAERSSAPVGSRDRSAPNLAAV